MQAIILAGGKGTRMGSLGKTTPKVLLPFGDKVLLDHLISHLKKNNIDNIIVCTGFLGDKIKNHIKQKKYDLKISISQENKPLGTAGAVHLIKNKLENEFFVVYGDEYININLKKMFRFHKQKGGEGVLVLHKSDHPQDSTVVKIDKKQNITKFVEKPGDEWKKFGALTATSVYILKKDVINFIPKNKESDFARDVFPKMIKAGKLLFGYKTLEYVKDIGTPERYAKVMELFKK